MRFGQLPLSAGVLVLLGLAAAQKCSVDSIETPSYFGTEILHIEAKEVHGFNEWSYLEHLNVPFDQNPADFCNITVTLTHPGQNDVENIYIWLPLTNWNGRFFGQGGGGWAAGAEGFLAPAVAHGYAAANTDAGHTFFPDPLQAAVNASGWALTSPGNVNWALLQDFAAKGLDDVAHIGKAVTQSFYGKAPKYSYWNGCSTGGRQGLIQAQRYPKNYDGILAAAPAINWASFLVAEQWGQVLMRKENYFPPKCESDAITKLAIESCDELDGVKDGVISNIGACTFDATSVVGEKYDCNGETRKISKSAAKIVNGVWEGTKQGDKYEWFGLNREASLSGAGMLGGLLQTICDDKDKNCKGSPFPISAGWIQLFLAKDPEYDVSTMTEEEFFGFLHQSRQQYTSIMGSDDPDLSEFRKAGGKIVSWHGLSDELIYPNGTSNYYERVLALDPNAADFYRYFEAPGVMHCSGGLGPYPSTALQSLIDWVEKGKAPDHLDAATVPMTEGQTVYHRPLCLYPKVASYKGGPPSEASSFECADSFGTKKASEHDEL